jgi:hypothetical protein
MTSVIKNDCLWTSKIHYFQLQDTCIYNKPIRCHSSSMGHNSVIIRNVFQGELSFHDLNFSIEVIWINFCFFEINNKFCMEWLKDLAFWLITSKWCPCFVLFYGSENDMTALSIEPGQPGLPSCLARLYTVGWLIILSPKLWMDCSKFNAGWVHYINLAW